MASYQVDEAIKRWGRGDLTAEQAIGQLFQLLQDLGIRVGSLEQRMEERRGEKPRTEREFKEKK